jgi:uncharacterized membrane protein
MKKRTIGNRLKWAGLIFILPFVAVPMAVAWWVFSIVRELVGE